MYALDVAPPEVDGHQHAEADGEKAGVDGLRLVHQFHYRIDEMPKIETGADHADGSGENVIEHQ